MSPILVSPTVVVPAGAIGFAASRSGGPGGQNVNKVSSKVELRVDLGQIQGLTVAQRGRLAALVRTRLDAEGRLLVLSQLTRDQPQNLQDAREKVRALVEACLKAPKRRVATKPSRAARARRLDDKRAHSDRKKGRRWSPE